MRPLVVVGHPEAKRVQLFSRELARLGLPPAAILPWAEVARDPRRAAEAIPPGAVVRIDSAGQHDAVERALIARGARATGKEPPLLPPPRRGLVLAPRLAHLGFVDALRELGDAVEARGDLSLATPVGSIEGLFDKRVTSATWAERGLPVPAPIVAGTELDSLLGAMREAGAKSAYVKVAFSSSAALLALVVDGSRPHAMTTVEEVSGARFNSRTVRRVSGQALASLVRFLLGEGAQVEAAMPKARIDGRFFDLRVVVIGGEASFVIVRTNTIPITNLHLGGRRGDLDAVRAACPADAWEAAMHDATRAAHAFPSASVGIDLLFSPRYRAHALIEGNAFGDFFPRLEQGGRTVYERVIEALRSV